MGVASCWQAHLLNSPMQPGGIVGWCWAATGQPVCLAAPACIAPLCPRLSMCLILLQWHNHQQAKLTCPGQLTAMQGAHECCPLSKVTRMCTVGR